MGWLAKEKGKTALPAAGGLGLWAASLCIAGLLAILCLFGLPFAPWKAAGEAPCVVLLGDSIIGGSFDGEGIAVYLEKELGRPVLNGGFGGTTASRQADLLKPYSVGAGLCLVNVADAIADGDFGELNALVAYGDRYLDIFDDMLDYFPRHLEELEAVPFDQVEYLVIEHGTNDYNRGLPLDNPQDPYDTGTFGGALRHALERLKGAYPDLEVILMTPTWCFIVQGEEVLDGDSADFGGGCLGEYVGLEKEIAEGYGIRVLDNYHGLGAWEEVREQYLYDGLHLNAAGQQLVAGRLADFLRQPK